MNKLGIPDPKTVTENAFDDVTKWPEVTLVAFFSCILKKKDFDACRLPRKIQKPESVLLFLQWFF